MKTQCQQSKTDGTITKRYDAQSNDEAKRVA
jgi:hypothetical protein